MKQQLKSPSSVADRDFEFSLDQAPARPAPSNDANFLMDEIFGDVEQALDDSLVPPTEAVSLEYKKSAMEFDIAAALADRYPQLALQLENAEAAAVVPEIPAPTTELAKPEEKQQQRQRAGSNLSIFERLMIFTGCASAIAALAVWVVSQGLVSKAANALGNKLGNSAVTATTAVPAVSEADAKFADYMLRALASIDRENAKDPNQAATPISPVQAAAAAPVKSGTTLPQPIALSAPNNAAVKPGGPSSKLAPPVRFETPVANAEPQGDVVTRSELNQVMNRIVGMLERVAPGVSNRLPLPQPVRIAAKPAAGAAASAAAPQVARATTPANLPQRVINGIVDFGDKSVVTFNINGVTQRVYLGENVGSTGWTLIKVEGTRATFRKNGELRTLGEGESL